MAQDFTPTFSVIIPVYNRSTVVGRAIRSVLDQNFQNIEIIIVDDGSTDNLEHVITSINDKRITYIYQENKGAAAARNRGVQEARGDYVAFLDSDDLWLNHHLAEALPYLRSGPDICVYGQVTVERGHGISFVKPPRGLKEGEDISEYLLCDRGFFPTCSVILPTSLAREALYDERVIYGDDVDFALKIAKAKGRFQFISHSVPSAVWFDLPNPERQSMHIDPALIENWLDRMKTHITDRARLGCMGWSVARGYAEQGKWFKAMRLYFHALLSGCYSPKMMAVVFLQVSLPRGIYRKLSDFLAQMGVAP